MPTAREAGPGEARALSAALAQAFRDEPVTEWMLPQRTRRRARRERMFQLELRTYVFPQGGVVTTADADDGDDGGLVGACVALPPDQWRMPDQVDGRTAMSFFRAHGLKLAQAIRMQRVMVEHHPTQPHYYVRWVGVRPGLRGQGLGSALMRNVLDRCDEELQPAYLEASSERQRRAIRAARLRPPGDADPARGRAADLADAAPAARVSVVRVGSLRPS
ncbi:MAG: GNAT family N-acetyltransferase [Nocardioides sp.]